MDDSIYFPVLPAKAGEIEAIGRLSPFAEVRVRPTLDIPLPREGVVLGQHLANIANEVTRSWGTRLPLYFDFSKFEPETQVDGHSVVEYFFGILRQHRVLAMPVSGPLSLRGPGTAYVDAVALVIRQDGRGAAIRIPLEDMQDSEEFERAIDGSLKALNIDENAVELFLDASALEILPEKVRTEESLFLVYNEAARLLASRRFRSIVMCASSIPKVVPHSADWTPLQVIRTEYNVWLKLLAQQTLPRIHFGDYGVTFAIQVEPKGPVRAPGRARLSVDGEHHLFKSKQEDHRKLCEAVIGLSGFYAQPSCWGKDAVRDCGAGSRGVGNSTDWVARDTNMHIETTVRMLAREIKAVRVYEGLNFASEVSKSWLQETIE